MCNPQYFQLAATGLQASNELQQGAQVADAARVNARGLDLQAADAMSRGAIEEARYTRDARQVEGSQKAAIGANNVTRSGTALDLLGDTAQIAAEDQEMIRRNAAREAYGARSQARELRRYGKAARGAGVLGFGTTLLTGSNRAYGMYKAQGA